MEMLDCMSLRTRREAGIYFILDFSLLENVSRVTRNAVQFANLLRLLISPLVSDCTNQIEMAPSQTGALTSTGRTKSSSFL
jgi:hypothetical protein